MTYSYDGKVGDLSEFSLGVKVYLKAYRWRSIDPVPFSPMSKKLSEARLALVSTAGFSLSGQPAFDDKAKGGDWTYRLIPKSSDAQSLIDTHRSKSFDHSGIRQDPDVAFPIDRARELVAEGRVGSLTEHHLSFMGSLTATKHLTRESAPAAAKLLVDEGAEAALLVPV